MPLYIFRCAASDGDHSLSWGISLPDIEAALAMAVGEAKALYRTMNSSNDARRFRFEVEDEDGMPILDVPVASVSQVGSA